MVTIPKSARTSGEATGVWGLKPPLSFTTTPVICTELTRKFMEVRGTGTVVSAHHTCVCELQNVTNTRFKENYVVDRGIMFL